MSNLKNIPKCCAVILATSIAVSAYAGEDKVSVASIDPDRTGAAVPFTPPVVKESYEYYDITGVSEQELSCQISQHGCAWRDGKKYASVTKWNVTWDYGYDRAPGACSAEAFKTRVDVTFRYPRWLRAGEAPRAALEASWDAYMKNLIKHESGHRDLAVDAAAEISRAVAAMPPAATCAELDREIRALCRTRLRKLNDEERSYDADTGHGIKQGAMFP